MRARVYARARMGTLRIGHRAKSARCRVRLDESMMPRAKLLGDRQPTELTAHHTPYLSSSRFSLYAECPALYQRRYVDRVRDPATIDMEYGSAIHAGLETYFKGGDGELAFLRDLKQRLAPLIEKGADPADWLAPQGINLIGNVARLGWTGLSEQKFWWTAPGFPVPITGFIDLWMPDQLVVVDWKTTQRAWTEKTAERYMFQRAIYTAAMTEKARALVTFRFVPLGAHPGGHVQVIEATPEPEDVFRTLEKARQIAAQIEAEQWDCRCGKHQEIAA